MTVPVYDLAMDPADCKWFRQHIGTERCFPAELRADGRSWPIWIGYRGRFSRWCAKPSFDIWFDPAARFQGHARLHLNAAYYDPSLLRGRLAFEVFDSLGVPTPGAWHAWLTLNGKPLGVYTAIEAFDADWLARQGKAAAAIYYGVGGGGNFGLLERRSTKPKRYLAKGYEKCYPDDDDFGDLESLIWQITLPDTPEFESEIDKVMDVEAHLRWLAGLVFISHTDGLTHNYALFRTEGERWRMSPWDCDGTFGRCPDGSRLPADHMPIGGGGGNYLNARLLISPRWKQRYADLWADLLRQELAHDTVMERVHRLYQEIRPLVKEDRNKRLSNSTFRHEPSQIGHYLTDRIAYIRRELERWQKP